MTGKPLHDFAAWVVSFDNPERANDRRHLTLEDVIAAAARALNDSRPTPPPTVDTSNVDHAALAAQARAQLAAARERHRLDRSALDATYAPTGDTHA